MSMSIAGLSGHKLASLYVLGSPIAHGAHGVVYEARHAFTAAPAAIKIFYPEILVPERLARCRREAEMVAALHHPGIVRITEWGRPAASPYTYCVMDLLTCENLQTRVRRLGPLPPARVLELGLRAGAALHAAHKLGVVHRGLTPRNVLYVARPPDAIDGAEIIKLLDFGVAHLPVRQGLRQELLPYLAPEVEHGAVGREPEVDPRTDQYSLAAILYEALTGRPPPLHDELMLDTESGPRPLESLCPEAPPFMVRAIERALSPLRSDRFASLTDFVRALDDRGLSPWRTSAASARSILSSWSQRTPSGASASSPARPASGSSAKSPPAAPPRPAPAAPSARRPASSPGLPPSIQSIGPVAGQQAHDSIAPRPRRGRVVWTSVISLGAVAAGLVYLNFTSRPGPARQAPPGSGAAVRAAAPAPAPDDPPPAAEDSVQQGRLEEAEKAVAQGDSTRAIELARQALPAQAAWRIIAAAACRLDDVRLFDEAMAQLGETDRAEVRRGCKRPSP